MALTLEAQRNETIAQVGVIIGAFTGTKNLDTLYWSLNPIAKQVAQLEARKQIDPITAGLILKTKCPNEIWKLISPDIVELAASKNPILPPNHIGYLGCWSAWACNCKPNPSGLWCGLIIFLGNSKIAELVDWNTGDIYRVIIPLESIGGIDVLLEWAK